MSLSADLEASELTVLLDLRHPLAYLALHPCIAFEKAQGIEINWLPLSTPTLNAPTVPGAGDDRGLRHRRYRAQAIAREIETYGAAQGLVLRALYRSADADAANLGWLWVRDRRPERLPTFLSELFRAYWSLDIEASSLEPIAALVDSVDADAASFLSWSDAEGAAAAASLAAALRDRGLFQVPAYVVEDEVFYGRQHLPMIRWILSGRSGRTPI